MERERVTVWMNWWRKSKRGVPRLKQVHSKHWLLWFWRLDFLRLHEKPFWCNQDLENVFLFAAFQASGSSVRCWRTVQGGGSIWDTMTQYFPSHSQTSTLKSVPLTPILQSSPFIGSRYTKHLWVSRKMLFKTDIIISALYQLVIAPKKYIRTCLCLNPHSTGVSVWLSNSLTSCWPWSTCVSSSPRVRLSSWLVTVLLPSSPSIHNSF